MPATRVIKHLGHLSALEIENLKAALAASRRGRKVIVTKASAAKPPKATANLVYLAIAVLLELWRRWGLDRLFDALLPAGNTAVAPSAIVAALTLQRCVAADSKLSMERWFPRTALPELLGVAPETVNNTRIHRVLDGLDQCGLDLMARLPRLYTQRDGAFAALFLDVTDTWFVGRGPENAERAKTKEGFVRRKVGIVLLCNERGYPLRWEVIRGKESDKQSMTRAVESIRGLSWVGNAPVVCDRSMGNTVHIRRLLTTKVPFLTALVRPEFDAYSATIPHAAFTDITVEPRMSKKDRSKRASEIGELAQSAGMTKVDDKLYVLDLGIIERKGDNGASPTAAADDDADLIVHAVHLGRKMREAEANGRAESTAAAGRMFGLKKGAANKYRRLTKLSEEIQLAILDGKATGASLGELLAIVRSSDLEVQHQAFDDLLTKLAARGKPKRSGQNRPAHNTPPTPADAAPVRVRGVIYFNPEMFVDQRRGGQQRLRDIETFTRDLNLRLQSPRCKLTEAKVRAQVQNKLESFHLVDAYVVEVGKADNERLTLRVSLDESKWAHRRRYDGFSFLVAHPDLEHTAAELCRLYRAKDMVEKDFETIKSFVELRPVRHRVDAKVRAHVTICMLALLLERTLNDNLAGKPTAQRALEELATCHLNHYATRGDVAAYDVTVLNDTQQRILRALRLQRLADDDEVTDRISPR